MIVVSDITKSYGDRELFAGLSFNIGARVSDSIERHRRLQVEISSLTGEWEKLNTEAESLKREKSGD